MEDLGVTASVSMSTENVERAFDRVGDKAAQMANKVAKEAEKAGAATDNMGAGAEKSAEKFTRAESRMRTAIQKSTRELEMLGKTASQKFEAQLDFKGLDKAKFQPFLDELRKAEEATKKAESGLSGLGSAAQAAGRAMAVAFSGAAAFGVVGKLVEVQREFDVLNSSLKTVTGSSAAAERELSWLKTFAKETPFGLAQATQGFVKMKALGLDPTRAALTSFGNTASAMGKDLNQMIEAVADASTGEFERLKEFGIKAKKEGDNVSLTFQGVTTTVKNSASEITKYLEDIGNVQFGGAMAERAKTLDGAISELGDTWDELFRTLNERNAGTLIYDSIKLANGAIEDATTIIKAMTAAYDDSGRATGALTTFQEGVATVFETVAVLGANLKYVITQVGVEIGGLAAQVAQAAQFNFAGVAAIREQMVADAEEARKQIDLTEKRILGARKAQEEYARYATRNASAATDPRRIDLGTSSAPTVATRAGARATKEALSEYDKLMQRLGVDLPKAAAAAEAAQHGYNKAQEEFIALAGSPVWAGFTSQQRAQVAALFENRIASEQAADAAKTLSKANADAAQARERYLTSLASGVDKIKADTAAQIEATARLGLSKEAIAELDAAKLEMLATDLELQAIKAMDRNLDEQTYNALKQQAEAYRELAAAKKAGATKEMALDLEKANAEAAKKAPDEWERAADDINRSLTDALMRGFESGKDFAENLRSTLKNMFSTLVLRPVISAALSPVAGAVNGFVGNAVGGAAGSGIGSGIATSIGTSAIGSAFSLGLTNFGTGVGSTLANGVFGGIGTNISNFGTLAGAGNLSGALGVAAPYLAGIGALYAIISSLDDSGTYHTGGAAQYSGARGLRTSLGFRDNEEGLPSYNPNDNIDNQFGTGFGYVERGDQTISAVSAIAQGLGTALDGVAVAFGQKAGYEIATAFADDTSKDGAWGALRISKDGQELLNWQDTRTSRWAPKEFGDGEEGYKQYLAAVAKDTRQVLLDMDLPGWADKMLESIGDSASMEQLTGVLNQIGVVQSAFVALGRSMEMFSGLTDEMQSGLLDAAGSIEALTAGAGAFYQGFYSEQERIDAAVAQLNETLAGLDLSIDPRLGDDAKDQFRAAVEAAFAAGDAELAAGLLSISGNFASAADYFEQLSQTAADAAADAAKQASIRADLERQLLELQGDTVALRKLDIASMDAYNVALYDQIQARKAADAVLQRIQDQAERDRQAALDEVDAAYSALQRSIDVQRSVAQEVINDTRAVFETLRSNVRSLYGEVGGTAAMQAAQGRAFIGQALSAAQTTGYLPDGQQLQEAIGAVRSEMQSKVYASQAEADYERLVLAGELKNLQDLSGDQLTEAEKQLKSLDGILDTARAQVDALKGINTSVMSVEDAIANLANALAVAKALGAGAGGAGGAMGPGGKPVGEYLAQVTPDMYKGYTKDQISGINNWTFGSSDAIKQAYQSGDYATAAQLVQRAGLSQAGLQNTFGLSAEDLAYVNSLGIRGVDPTQAVAGSDIVLGGGTATNTGQSALFDTLAQQAQAALKAGNELGIYTEAAARGLDSGDINALLGLPAGSAEEWAKKAGLPVLRVGTNYVEEDGLHYLHKGEAVIPQPYNPAAGGGMGNTARLEALVEGLTKEVQRLQAVVNDGNREQRRTANAVNGNPDMPMLVQTV